MPKTKYHLSSIAQNNSLLNANEGILKVDSAIDNQYEEYKKFHQELYQTYEGNPKRGTLKPSTKRILNVFKGISMAVIFLNQNFQFAVMSQLLTVQLKTLE